MIKHFSFMWRHNIIGFVVFEAVVMKNYIFWHKHLLSVENIRRFEGTGHLCLQVLKNKPNREAGRKHRHLCLLLASRRFLASLTIQP
jgi:hypothetical protein